MTTVYPTHTCFDDALDLLVEILRHNPDEWGNLFVVHALCRRPEFDELYAHAWIYDRLANRCLWIGIINGKRQNLQTTAAEFLTHYQPVDWTAYSAKEALALNRAHHHFGPWVSRYRDHCRNSSFTASAVRCSPRQSPRSTTRTQ